MNATKAEATGSDDPAEARKRRLKELAGSSTSITFRQGPVRRLEARPQE